MPASFLLLPRSSAPVVRPGWLQLRPDVPCRAPDDRGSPVLCGRKAHRWISGDTSIQSTAPGLAPAPILFLFSLTCCAAGSSDLLGIRIARLGSLLRWQSPGPGPTIQIQEASAGPLGSVCSARFPHHSNECQRSLQHTLQTAVQGVGDVSVLCHVLAFP